jgi:glycosyltransferase involved in cell wall biosynthesis
MDAASRHKLAFIEGFRKPSASQAQGTNQSAYLVCQALAQHGRYRALDVYQDLDRRSPAFGEMTLPRTPPTRLFEKPFLRSSTEHYAAIYVANGDQILASPYVLRPRHDWAPVICSVGTAHANSQWANLLLSLAGGTVRSSDALIFKSQAAANLFREVWDGWCQRLGLAPAFPSLTPVVPNGVDVEVNQRSEPAGRAMRRRLGLHEGDLVFLSFSRLGPGTKGDLEALIVRFREVVAAVPRALLLLSGAAADRSYLADLRQLARAAGVADRVLILDNPFEIAPDARGSLMSAADVFVHLSTGVEEASSLAVQEAMAHALPVIATAWAGMPEVITAGENGFLVPTRAAPLPDHVVDTLFGQTDRTHLVHASKVVSCDWRAFVRAALALSNPAARQTMAAAARARAVAGAIGVMAARYVQIFEEAAAAACKDWKGPAAPPPLVDLNTVLRAQATSVLSPSDRVRIGDPERARFLGAGLYPEMPERVQRVIAGFMGREELSVAELVQIAGSGLVPAGQSPAAETASAEALLAFSSRFVVRLLNFGVLELT